MKKPSFNEDFIRFGGGKKFGFVQLCWDWIVRYCLEHKIYNINQVNMLLFEYDQEQLGA